MMEAASTAAVSSGDYFVNELGYGALGVVQLLSSFKISSARRSSAPVCARLTHVPVRMAIARPLSLIRYPGCRPRMVSINKGPNSHGWRVSLACLMTLMIAERLGSTVIAASRWSRLSMIQQPVIFRVVLACGEILVCAAAVECVFRYLWGVP